MEEGEQPVLAGGGKEGLELGDGPDGSRFAGRHTWPFRPFHGVAADEAIDDDSVTECFPQDRMQVNDGRDGKWFAVEASTGQKVAVQLRDRGWPDSLDRHVADVRRDVEPDASPVVQ